MHLTDKVIGERNMYNISVNQSVSYALALKQVNNIMNFQTAVFNKAVDSFEQQGEMVTELLNKTDVNTDIGQLLDILV